MKGRKLAFAALAGLITIGGTTRAGSFEELKQLLNQKDVNITVAVTGDYIYTADRKDTINGVTNYEDQFATTGYFAIEKTATEQSPFGFKVGVGNEWAPVVGVEPLPDVDTQVKIHEAYVEAKFANFDLQMGRLLTNIGGEAPYTWQNINIQRGLLWNGEPVFYNGVRVTGELGRFGVYAGVNDRNTSDGKMALEAGISANLPYNTAASLNVLIPDKNDKCPTRVIDFVINTAYNNIPVTFYVDYLITPQKGQDAQSIGAALLADLPVNEQLSVGGRVEYVHNDGDGDNYGIGTGNYAWTFTVTPKYQLNKYLYIRGEASYVTLKNKVYDKDNNSMTDNEFRLAAEVGFVF